MAEKTIKQTINNVNIVGTLVKMGLEERDGEKCDSINGSLVIRTADGSENQVGYFAYKYKKDANGNFGNEPNGLYKGLKTIIDEYKSLEKYPDEADIVKIGSGKIGIQDYISKSDKMLKSYNDISANFCNRLSPQEIEKTPLMATFEVQGIITKIVDETRKDLATNSQVSTGNCEVHIDIVGYEGTLIPVKLTVMQPMVQPFVNAGFYEGGVAKFSGKVVNTTTVQEIVEKQTFGEDLKKVITTTVRRFEVTGGSPQGTIYDLGYDDAMYEAMKSKRRLKLTEIKNKADNPTGFSGSKSNGNNKFGGSNPFSTNPFSK